MKTILEQIRAEIAAVEERLETLREIEGALEKLLGTAEQLDPDTVTARLGKPGIYADVIPPPGGREALAILPSKSIMEAISITEAIQTELEELGPATKGELEKALSVSRSLGKQTVSAALQAMKRRGTVKLMKGGKWKLI